MRIGAVTLAYNDETTIGGTLKCLQPFVEKQMVMLSETPYFGNQVAPDRTEEIAEELGAKVVKGSWELDHDQRTLGNILCADCDWVLGFDSDEMMTHKDLDKLNRFLEETPHEAVGVLPEIYWNTTNYRLRPKPSYTPIIAMRPSVKFTHIRNIDNNYTIWEGGEMHYLSWCRPKDIYKKVTSYAHAPDFDGEKWYVDKYLNWIDGDKAELPDGIYDAVYNPLPEELRGYLEHENK